MIDQRLTQSERRTRTRSAVLASACRLFGGKGYSATSLEDIANDCGLTTRPIYHYFGNKKALFAAVNEHMEQRILAVVTKESVAKEPVAKVPAEHETLHTWSRFLELCEDPGFRQIVLIDSPNILGRERWPHSQVVQKVIAQTGDHRSSTPAPADPRKQFRRELTVRMTISALAEAAMMVAEARDVTMARQQAEQVLRQLLPERH